MIQSHDSRRVRMFLPAGLLAFALLPQNAVSATLSVTQQNLVSDIPGLAGTTDPNLVNPWGISFGPTTPFWVSDNGAGVTTLYNGAGQPAPVTNPLIVTIPPPAGGSPPSAPTGQVFNSTSGFEITAGQPARFIFATEDGTISAWNPGSGTSAVLKVDNSASGAIYKGLAIADTAAGARIYAANFSAGTIDVFDAGFAQVSGPGSFTDAEIPSGFAPFNIQNIGGKLYVTYAKQDAAKEDDVAGAGNGFVDVFNADGSLDKRLVSNGPLNSPWGLTLAPGTFGPFGGALLVGNFGDGTIHAFNTDTGQLEGQLADASGNPLSIEGLWALKPGSGSNGFDPAKVYFSAGISGGGQIEDHGLFGSLEPVPEPATTLLVGLGLFGLGWVRMRARHA